MHEVLIEVQWLAVVRISKNTSTLDLPLGLGMQLVTRKLQVWDRCDMMAIKAAVSHCCNEHEIYEDNSDELIRWKTLRDSVALRFFFFAWPSSQLCSKIFSRPTLCSLRGLIVVTQCWYSLINPNSKRMVCWYIEWKMLMLVQLRDQV
jgi:hypothetical protein